MRRQPAVYFSFFAFAPLTFAVPRSVFCLFLRCLPVRERCVSRQFQCAQRSEGVQFSPCLSSSPAEYQNDAWKIRTLLSARLLDLGSEAHADQSVVGLELLHRLGGVVDQGEAGGLAATELRAQAEDVDLVLGGLVHAGELLAELILGDVGAAGVQDVTVNKQKRSATTFSRLARNPSPPSFPRRVCPRTSSHR